ncbi:MAG: carbon storage regulator [Planctomycetota bacterium]|nr:MAG: carbon storage regulator [Planctomycetota bacterium]REJ86549.1 MAG: carbon storage regulator [Planctomycetota bacterium]REK21470.1 MAG: carbon storage regulator [Planctomycetota bacterium]REK40139.1 MAG: carbon storage regulator [Planctomycetota bacterium]
MLVLTRKKSQMIQIGENIVVKVIQTGRGSVKIGVDAPADVRVLRGELSEELANLKEGESLNARHSFRPTVNRFTPMAAEAVVYEAV